MKIYIVSGAVVFIESHIVNRLLIAVLLLLVSCRTSESRETRGSATSSASAGQALLTVEQDCARMGGNVWVQELRSRGVLLTDRGPCPEKPRYQFPEVFASGSDEERDYFDCVKNHGWDCIGSTWSVCLGHALRMNSSHGGAVVSKVDETTQIEQIRLDLSDPSEDVNAAWSSILYLFDHGRYQGTCFRQGVLVRIFSSIGMLDESALAVISKPRVLPAECMEGRRAHALARTKEMVGIVSPSCPFLLNRNRIRTFLCGNVELYASEGSDAERALLTLGCSVNQGKISNFKQVMISTPNTCQGTTSVIERSKTATLGCIGTVSHLHLEDQDIAFKQIRRGLN